MDVHTLVLLCAPFVASDTMLAIIQQESSGNQWAIGVNTGQQFVRAQNYDQAVSEAKRLIASGASIDMGLMQINSTTMKGLGLSVEQIFDPCTNVYSGGVVLTRNYYRASIRHGEGHEALKAALSAYNTGDFKRGLANGYVQKVLNKAKK